MKERVWLHIRHQRPCPPAGGAAASSATGPPPGPMIRLPRRWVRWCDSRLRSLAKYRCPYPNFRRRSSKSGREKRNDHQLSINHAESSLEVLLLRWSELSSPSCCCFSLPHCQPAPALNLQGDLSTPSPFVSTLFLLLFLSLSLSELWQQICYGKSVKSLTYLQPGGGWNPAVGLT